MLAPTCSRRLRFVAAIRRTFDGDVVVGADAPDLAALEHAQQLRLQVDGSSPISSRKTVPPAGRLEHALARRHRAREGAALVAEQLALEQVAAASRRSRRPGTACRGAGCRGGSPRPRPPCRCRSRPRAGWWPRWSTPCPARRTPTASRASARPCVRSALRRAACGPCRRYPGVQVCYRSAPRARTVGTRRHRLGTSTIGGPRLDRDNREMRICAR